MTVVRLDTNPSEVEALGNLPREVTEDDVAVYHQLISRELSEDQQERILRPPQVYPRQQSVLAVHWHPEFVPMEMIRQRVEATFPAVEESLLIPTQHNELTSYGEFTGVEIDCYAPEFNRKVQLLFHFSKARIEGRGDVFRAMLQHTFEYRTSQLYEFLDTLLKPEFEDRLQEAAKQTGASSALVEFVKNHAMRVKVLVERFESSTPREAIRNKLLRDFINAHADKYETKTVSHAQIFLRAVKQVVKRHFSLEYFYRAQEFIEEGRSLGAGIVIPHPEQFWPILLADLDIDGIEVWNPQSLEYTEFLVSVVDRENRTTRRNSRPLLVTMGDDCHMGEKVKDPRRQDKEKAAREIGVQPPWDDLSISKTLITANQSRERVIDEYRARLTS